MCLLIFKYIYNFTSFSTFHICGLLGKEHFFQNRWSFIFAYRCLLEKNRTWFRKVNPLSFCHILLLVSFKSRFHGQIAMWKLHLVLFRRSLKGQCHEICCFWFLSWISFPPGSEYPNRTVSNFFENSRRYSQVKVHHRCQRHWWQICHWCRWYRSQFATSVVDTAGKFATGINDTGGKFCH